MPPLTLSVLVPAHADNADLRRCLSALAASDPPADEIILLLDGASLRVEEPLPPGIRVVQSDHHGPARARNLAAETATGDLLLFIDSDVLVYPDTIGRMARCFMEYPQISAVFGSYDDAPAAPNFISQYKNLLHHFVHQNANEQASTFWSGCGTLRRDVFQAVGGFEESCRRPAIEDIELGYRLVKAGYLIRLCKHIQVKHLKHWSMAKLIHSDVFMRGIPWTEIIWRDGRFVNDLNLRTDSRISVVMVYLLILFLLGSIWLPPLLLGVFLLVGALLILNRDVYIFFANKRGFVFMLGSILMHWFYYLYSGLSFLAGTALYFYKRLGGK